MLEQALIVMPEKTCTEVLPDGAVCGRPHFARDLCAAHYQARRRREQGRVRRMKTVEHPEAVYTRVSRRTDELMAYLAEQADISRFELARQWLEKEAALHPDPPESFLEAYRREQYLKKLEKPSK